MHQQTEAQSQARYRPDLGSGHLLAVTPYSHLLPGTPLSFPWAAQAPAISAADAPQYLAGPPVPGRPRPLPQQKMTPKQTQEYWAANRSLYEQQRFGQPQYATSQYAEYMKQMQAKHPAAASYRFPPSPAATRPLV